MSHLAQGFIGFVGVAGRVGIAVMADPDLLAAKEVEMEVEVVDVAT